MIGKYLQVLLENNKRVIIPDFGGFVVKRSSVGDVVSFNSFLKFNDGLLINLIMKDLGVVDDEAIKMIQDELAVIQNDLKMKGSFVLDDMGYLVKDKKGNIRFMKEIPNLNLSAQMTKKEAKAAKKKPVSFEEELPVSQHDDILTELFDDTEEESMIENDTMESEGEFTPNEPLLVQTEVQDPIEEELVQEFEEEEGEKPQKKPYPRWYWIVLAVVLVLLVALVWGMKGSLANKHKQIVSEKADVVIKAIDEQPPAPVELEYFMQPLESAESHGITLVADKDIAPLGDERYNVIIASLSVYENAVKHNDRLKNEGIASDIFDRYNGFYAVSIGGYSTLDKALEVCGKKVKEVSDVWILVK